MSTGAAATAQARVVQLNDAWTKLLDQPDEGVAASLHGDLDALKAQALVESWRDIQLLCSKLEHLVFLAHRHHYDVPMEVLLTVSMAFELLQTLVAAPSVEQRSADLAGFIAQLDAVLRDSAALSPGAMGEGPPHGVSSKAVSKLPTAGGEDRLGRATRQRLAAAATTIYLESIRARGASSLRLRETWVLLRRDISDLGRVELGARLLRTLGPTRELAASRGINVDLTVEANDVVVSPEIARLLEGAVLQLLHNAATHGLSALDRRELRVRVVARVVDGAVVVTTEDDGVGFDAVASEAARDGGLASVRSAIRHEGGSMLVRSVPGRGTSIAMTVVDPSMGFAVRTFRSGGGHLLHAVDTSWALATAEWTSAVLLDPIAALGLRGAHEEGTTTHTATFRRGDLAFELPVRSLPALSAATRICPTALDSPAEVVLVGDAEALLLRLDRLGAGGAQSTVPPRVLERPPVRAVASPHPAPARPRAAAGWKVLLLDGDSTWLVLTRAALLHRGFDVHAVSTLTDLGEALERSAPDVVLADPEKLDISADELGRQVKHVRPLVPVMFFDRTLPKSLGPDELARVIGERCLRPPPPPPLEDEPAQATATPRPTLPSARRQ